MLRNILLLNLIFYLSWGWYQFLFFFNWWKTSWEQWKQYAETYCKPFTPYKLFKAYLPTFSLEAQSSTTSAPMSPVLPKQVLSSSAPSEILLGPFPLPLINIVFKPFWFHHRSAQRTMADSPPPDSVSDHNISSPPFFRPSGPSTTIIAIVGWDGVSGLVFTLALPLLANYNTLIMLLHKFPSGCPTPDKPTRNWWEHLCRQWQEGFLAQFHLKHNLEPLSFI